MPLAPLIDMHTHFFPKEVAEKPREFAKQQGELFWADSTAPLKKIALQGWAQPKDWLHTMQQAGVTRSVLQGWYWQNFHTCELQTEWYGELLQQWPDHFSAFVPVQPQAGARACLDLLEHAARSGFSGIGEIHPGAQQFSLRDETWLTVVEFAIDRDWPVLLHVTEPVGRPYTPKAATCFSDIQWLVEQFPELRLILAHWGGLIFTHELNPYIRKKWKNVYYDMAASPLLYDPRVYSIASSILPEEKVLFGSDFPLRVFPEVDAQTGFQRFVESFRNQVDPPSTLQAWGYDNAHRLLNGIG